MSETEQLSSYQQFSLNRTQLSQSYNVMYQLNLFLSMKNQNHTLTIGDRKVNLLNTLASIDHIILQQIISQKQI